MSTLLSKLDSGAEVTVLVTGAAGQIAYSLLPLISTGGLLGPLTRVRLHLFDVAASLPKLAGVVMELEDLASPLLASVLATADEAAAYAGVDVALLLGAKPRGPGEERSALLAANAAIFRAAGAALAAHASRDVRVLVVGNPANTNALIAARAAAPALPARHFTALTRLDANRATSALARRLGAVPSALQGVTVWGNHSSTQFPDAAHATLAGAPLALAPADAAWVRAEWVAFVQGRGAAVIAARGASSAASAAHAIAQHVHDWLLGSAGAAVSMAVFTDEESASAGYCAAQGIVFSQPVVCDRGGAWRIARGLPVDAHARAMLSATEKELVEERGLAFAAVAQPPA
jgi:malate dehydrogenase